AARPARRSRSPDRCRPGAAASGPPPGPPRRAAAFRIGGQRGAARGPPAADRPTLPRARGSPVLSLSVGWRRCRRPRWGRSRRGPGTGRARFAGGGGAFAFPRELAALFRRQPLVFLPFFPPGPALLRRQLLQRLVLLPGYPPLLGRQARPRAHLLLDALLLRRGHFGIPLRDAQPLLLARGIQLVPLRGKGREGCFIRG